MTDATFEDRWDVVVGLCHVRGWTVLPGSGDWHEVAIDLGDDNNDAGVGVYKELVSRDERGLMDMLNLLHKGPPRPYKVNTRYTFGFTDPRGLYGSTNS